MFYKSDLYREEPGISELRNNLQRDLDFAEGGVDVANEYLSEMIKIFDGDESRSTEIVILLAELLAVTREINYRQLQILKNMEGFEHQ